MSNAVKTVAAALVLGMILPGAAAAAPPPLTEPVILSFAAEGRGSVSYRYAVALRAQLIKGLPQGSAIYITQRSSGSAGGLMLLENGYCDLVLSSAAPAAWAADSGILGQPPVQHVRSLGGGLGHDFINIMFTKNFVERTGIRTLEKLASAKHPVRLAIKKDGTMGELTAEKVLEALGVSLQTVRSWGGDVLKTGSYGIKAALEDDFYDLTIDHLSAADPGTQELCRSHEMVQVQLADKTLHRLEAMGYEELSLEPGTWPGQAAAVKTAGSTQLVLVSSSMSDSVAYALTRALSEGAAELGRAVPELGKFDPVGAGRRFADGIELHPGARSYYLEQGYMVD